MQIPAYPLQRKKEVSELIQTKNGPIYEPTVSFTKDIYEWLKRHKDALEGSRAYEDMKEIYETLEFDYGQNKKLVG